MADRYMTCTLTDDTYLNFDKCCTGVGEFGSQGDMVLFKQEVGKGYVSLAIIPKIRIKMIESKKNLNGGNKKCLNADNAEATATPQI